MELIRAGFPAPHVAANGIETCCLGWVENLSDLVDGELLAAVRHFIRNADSRSRWPVPGEILRAHDEVRELTTPRFEPYARESIRPPVNLAEWRARMAATTPSAPPLSPAIDAWAREQEQANDPDADVVRQLRTIARRRSGAPADGDAAVDARTIARLERALADERGTRAGQAPSEAL